MNVETEAITLGARLDQFLNHCQELSSMELYIGTVTLMALAALIVLYPAGVNHEEEAAKEAKPVALSKPSRPLPVWHVYVRFVNFFLLACFLASLVAFFSRVPDASPIVYRYLLGWSAYLVYFFSFSGVSLLYDMEEEAASFVAASASEKNSKTTTKTDSLKSTSATPKVILPLTTCAPVCADPSSFKTSSTSVDVTDLTDDQAVADMVLNGTLKDHELEKKLGDCERAVVVRRRVMSAKLRQIQPHLSADPLEQLPYQHSLDYSRVFGANCEIVVGYVPLPVGMVGPLTLNGQSVFIPMATTEGCLVASTNRGAKVINEGGGAHAVIVRDGITRAPCVRLPSARRAAALKLWCETPEHFRLLKEAFESTTSFGKLKSCVPTVAGKNVYLRLTCFAGDAMGMNMVSKGSLAVIETLQQHFPDCLLVALSGNMCTDKKAAATNWIEGRGKSVVVEATIPKATVQRTLKTTVAAMVHTNLQKNLIGSAMAGAIGGFNAHAANMVTAVFLATGQDPAQNVESSNCITLLEECPDTGDLWISCTMPSLEVGTVGGGTSLPAQAACLKAIGCQGGGATPGENAQQLAMVVAAAVMAGELSLLAALAANTLVAAHMQHNRKPQPAKA